MTHRTRFCLLAVLCAACRTASAADSFPPEEPPTVAIARFEDGQLILRQRVRRLIPAVVTEKVPVIREVDGKKVTTFREEQRTVYKPVLETVENRMKTSEFSLYNAAGQELPAADAVDLVKPRVVLVSRNGKPVAKFYRSLYREDTLVIVTKRPKPVRLPVPTLVRPAPAKTPAPAPDKAPSPAPKPPENR